MTLKYPLGICKETMGTLNAEFNQYRGLFPMKVFVTGPPAVGKTHFAEKLCEEYGVPHITVKTVVEMGYNLTNELG
jgi:adenylate kinase